MSRPGKPIAKNSNSRFTTRNNKQEIFSKIAKTSKQKTEIKIHTTDVSKANTDQPK